MPKKETALKKLLREQKERKKKKGKESQKGGMIGVTKRRIKKAAARAKNY